MIFSNNNEFNFINDYLIEIYTRGVRSENTFCLLGSLEDNIQNALRLKQKDPRYSYSVNCLICWLYKIGKIKDLYNINYEFYKSQINDY